MTRQASEGCDLERSGGGIMAGERVESPLSVLFIQNSIKFEIANAEDFSLQAMRDDATTPQRDE